MGDSPEYRIECLDFHTTRWDTFFRRVHAPAREAQTLRKQAESDTTPFTRLFSQFRCDRAPVLLRDKVLRLLVKADHLELDRAKGPHWQRQS